jgi:two-component system chemotaxis response regulator CheB
VTAELIVIGASIGGPRAIETILRALEPSPRLPIAIVQHMPRGYTRSFADRLDRLMPYPVYEAVDGMTLAPGTATIGPIGEHFRVVRSDGVFTVSLDEEPATVMHRPSVDVLFASAVGAAARKTCAVLLTGMGSDGAKGMALLHRAGAFTIAQSAASCVTYGMPGAAVELGAVSEVLPLDSIGPRLVSLHAPAHTRDEGIT